jgi:hypothetical protein
MRSTLMLAAQRLSTACSLRPCRYSANKLKCAPVPAAVFDAAVIEALRPSKPQCCSICNMHVLKALIHMPDDHCNQMVVRFMRWLLCGSGASGM